jgi:hypothetical protein
MGNKRWSELFLSLGEIWADFRAGMRSGTIEELEHHIERGIAKSDRNMEAMLAELRRVRDLQASVSKPN